MQQNCSKTSKIFHFPKLSSFLKDFLTFEYGWKTHFRRVQKHCQMVKSAIRQPQIDSVSFANKNQFEDCFWLMVEIAFLRKKNFALSSFPLLSYLLIFMLALEEVVASSQRWDFFGRFETLCDGRQHLWSSKTSDFSTLTLWTCSTVCTGQSRNGMRLGKPLDQSFSPCSWPLPTWQYTLLYISYSSLGRMNELRVKFNFKLIFGFSGGFSSRNDGSRWKR